MNRSSFGALVFSVAVLAASCGDAGRLDQACTSNSDCAETEFCATGFCGGFGLCEPRPECDETIEELVCGCDGLTYPNADCASAVGVRLQETNACVCENNEGCVGGQYCARSDSCEEPGECLDRPQMCEPLDEPVCGCDSTNYENACDAAQAGARVGATGQCECQSDADCEAGEFCDADVCDAPTGVCALRNDPACEGAGPVRGCDGVRYDDECAAAEAGVRVRP